MLGTPRVSIVANLVKH